MRSPTAWQRSASRSTRSLSGRQARTPMRMRTDMELPRMKARRRAKARREARAGKTALAMRVRLGAALVAIAAFSVSHSRAEERLACEREMTRAAATNGVPLNVLYSVGLTETG